MKCVFNISAFTNKQKKVKNENICDGKNNKRFN